MTAPIHADSSTGLRSSPDWPPGETEWLMFTESASTFSLSAGSILCQGMELYVQHAACVAASLDTGPLREEDTPSVDGNQVGSTINNDINADLWSSG
jgi:hypothetical protein